MDGWRRLRLILSALVLCRGIVLLCVFPPFEGWDEYQHVGYIVHWNETGERPWLGRTIVPESLTAQLPSFPHCPSALKQMGTLGAVDYDTFWERARQGQTPAAKPLSTGTISLYQAQHGPLYYAMAGPLFELLGGVHDLRTSVGGLRLVNLGFTVGSVWIALGIMARWVRDRRLAAFCGLLIATQPLFLINGVRVANDAMGVFLSTMAIAWALHSTRRYRLASNLGLGMLVGLAVLAKSVNFGVIPFIAACWLWRSVRHRVGFANAMVAALATACGFLLVNQSEFRANWTRFGSVTVMQEAVANHRAGYGFADLARTARSLAWTDFVRNLWFRKNLMSGGWSWAGANPRMLARHECLIVTGLLGWGWWVFPRGRARIRKLFQGPAFPTLCLVLCGGYSVSLGYHAVQSSLCWGTSSTNPWYAATAYPWFLVLVAAGAFAWPLGRLRSVLPMSLVLFFLQAESSIVLGSMLSRYTARADWTEALRRLASLQPSFYGTTTLYMAMAGVLVLASLAITEAIRRALEPSRSLPTVGSRHRRHRRPAKSSVV